MIVKVTKEVIYQLKNMKLLFPNIKTHKQTL